MFRFSFHLSPPLKTNIYTKNNGLEDVSPFKYGVILGIQPLIFGGVAPLKKSCFALVQGTTTSSDELPHAALSGSTVFQPRNTKKPCYSLIPGAFTNLFTKYNGQVIDVLIYEYEWYCGCFWFVDISQPSKRC